MRPRSLPLLQGESDLRSARHCSFVDLFESRSDSQKESRRCHFVTVSNLPRNVLKIPSSMSTLGISRSCLVADEACPLVIWSSLHLVLVRISPVHDDLMYLVRSWSLPGNHRLQHSAASPCVYLPRSPLDQSCQEAETRLYSPAGDCWTMAAALARSDCCDDTPPYCRRRQKRRSRRQGLGGPGPARGDWMEGLALLPACLAESSEVVGLPAAAPAVGLTRPPGSDSGTVVAGLSKEKGIRYELLVHK